MRSVRWARVAVAVSLLGCGADEPLVSNGPGDRGRTEDPAGAVDSGTGTGTKDSGGKSSEDPPAPPSNTNRDAGAKSDASGGSDNCGQEQFRTSTPTPDILIVLDRSGSMRPGASNVRCDNLDQLDPITQGLRFAECLAQGIDCSTERDKKTVNCGGTEVRAIDRWAPSVAAIKKLTTDFQGDVAFGLLTFPGQGGGGGGNSCTPGSLQVPIGRDTADEIAGVLDKTQPGGGTPTGQALQTALEEFRKLNSADNARSERYVVLVTDGQPTCPNGQGGGRRNGGAADKQLTLDALDALVDEDVKTYVIGYDAALDPQFADALNEFAKHGQTEKYYAVQDEASLAEAFRTISAAVIRCDVELSTIVSDPEDIHVTLDNNPLTLGDPNGWRLDGQTVFIEGDACAQLQLGEGHKIEVVVDCLSFY